LHKADRGARCRKRVCPRTVSKFSALRIRRVSKVWLAPDFCSVAGLKNGRSCRAAEEIIMRILTMGIILLLGMASTAAAQFGKQVAVQVGTPEDNALTAIQAATNPHQKLALLNKFAATHPTGDMALMANNLYVSIYSSLKEYTKAYEYGDKALALDPNNLNVAVELIRDAQLQGSTSKMVHYGVKVGQMVSKYKAKPAPAGMSANEWTAQQKQTLDSAQPDVDWVVQSVYTAISNEGSSSTQKAHMAQMAKVFPNFPHAPQM
jgi:tetratricopeptide (TPR) repeat protein